MTDFAAAREAMVDRQVRTADVTLYPIIAAMLAVPREDFVPETLAPVAYLGEHVPLGGGRVVLDPRVFAKLLDALNIGPGDLVLDVGCGLGYSTAVLAAMAEAVVAVEEGEIAAEAEQALARNAVDTAIVKTGPLAAGAPEHGPFDAMILEGGIEVMPEALADQLKPGGRVAAVFVSGGNGQARLGLRTADGIAWRRIFDATAPVLPGFAATKAFEF
ncbi:MAG: rRNA adenine N-6-methyltransferase family protein [Amaricoccus sp.]|uniref:protein-L-isoaspartate O-methyltransferase family protein n=1 Tax=Amaricoccus sp. TaxID=1872485 RepID=UPI0039E6E073